MKCAVLRAGCEPGLTRFFLPGEEFYEASPYEPVTARLSDIFRLASIFSGEWACVGALPVLLRSPGAGRSTLGAWVRCLLASKPLNTAKPGVFICKENTMTPSPLLLTTTKVVCGLKHLWEWPRMTCHAGGLESDIWYCFPILSLILPGGVLPRCSALVNLLNLSVPQFALWCRGEGTYLVGWLYGQNEPMVDLGSACCWARGSC